VLRLQENSLGLEIWLPHNVRVKKELTSNKILFYHLAGREENIRLVINKCLANVSIQS